MSRPGARLIEEMGRYAVRTSADRRRRPVCTLGQDGFAALARAGALKPIGEGVWTLTTAAPDLTDSTDSFPSPGRPGFLEGERLVVEADGTVAARRANLGESPLAWLGRRKDGAGQPWLGPAELAAGERLREDLRRAGRVGRLTMDWSAGPRDRNPRGPGEEPAGHARDAKDRLHAALEAAGPGLREIVERVCLAEASLESAERALGHPRRSGKTLLKLGLQRIATFYGIG